MTHPAWLHTLPDGDLDLDLLIVPRASRTRVLGEHDGRLKLQIAAPPVDGEANKALLTFLARALGVSRSDLSIVTGDTGRRKRVRVRGSSAASILQALQ